MGSSLSIANSVLKHLDNALDVVSSNIGGVGDENYHKRVVPPASQTIANQNYGIYTDSVHREIDMRVQTALFSRLSNKEHDEVLFQYSERVLIEMGNTTHGEIIGAPNNTIENQISELMNVINELIGDNGDYVSKRKVVNSNIELANKISSLASTVQDLRLEVDQEIHNATEHINYTVKELYKINKQIGKTPKFGASGARQDLEDIRDKFVKELSGYMNLHYHISEGGEAVINMNRATLISSIGYSLMGYKPASSKLDLLANAELNPLTVTSVKSNVDGEVRVGNSVNMISSGTEGNISTYLKSGKLVGLHKLRDEILINVLNQLDNFAYQLKNDVNKEHNNGGAFPPPTSLKGSYQVAGNDTVNFDGSVKFAVLDREG